MYCRKDSRSRILFLAVPIIPMVNCLLKTTCCVYWRLCWSFSMKLVEFSARSFVSLTAAYSMVVLRTFSKWAGLAGLREVWYFPRPDALLIG